MPGEETTFTAFLLSMDLKATACSRFRVNQLNFQTRMTSKGGVRPAPLLDHLPELWPVGDPAALGLVYVLAGNDVAVGFRVVLQRSKLDTLGYRAAGVRGCLCSMCKFSSYIVSPMQHDLPSPFLQARATPSREQPPNRNPDA